MLFGNEECTQANQYLQALQDNTFKQFLNGKADAIVCTLADIIEHTPRIAQVYATEAYKLLMAGGLITEKAWYNRYTELIVYGMAFSNLFFVYDADTGKTTLNTTSFSQILSLVETKFLIPKGDNLIVELESFKNAIVDSSRIKNSIKTGDLLQVVRLDPQVIGNTVKFTGTVPRSQICLSRSVIIPFSCYTLCNDQLLNLFKSNLIKVTMGDKVRNVTLNRDILSQVYSNERVESLLSFKSIPLARRLYIPSVGASVTTLGVTNINPLAIDKLELAKLDEIDLSDINTNMLGAKDFYIDSVKSMDSEKLSALGSIVGHITNLNAPAQYREICLAFKPKYGDDRDYYEFMKEHSDIFDLETFYKTPSKYGSLFESVNPNINTQELINLLDTGVCRITFTSDRGMSTKIVTRNPQKLRQILGNDYVRKYETLSVRLLSAMRNIENMDSTQISAETIYKLNEFFDIGIQPTSQLMSKVEVIQILNAMLGSVQQDYYPNAIGDTIVKVRNCQPRLVNDKYIDYYMSIDTRKIVAITRLS